MKINSLELENFKFHKELSFDIKNQNCIIYGENGTGKSSIYWSLVSVFKKDLVELSDFKNRDMLDTDESKIIIKLDNEELNLVDINPLAENNRTTIFFAHQDMLEEFLVYSNNFFDILNNKIKQYFTNIGNFSFSLDEFNRELDETNYKEKVVLRAKLTEEYEEFLEKLLVKTNDIINNHFNENFTINFDYDWGLIDLSRKDYNFISPIIILQIENQASLKLQFNEAKLKLVSIALFFALIKLEENEENPLKLLVLDDFLTSLDMANRKLIVQYILDNFEEYQKIILTHNIQFYNLIVKFLKMRDEDKRWDIKNIFLTENDTTSEINTQNKNYLDDAKKQLLVGQYHSSGNYSRKEFERIVNEFKQLLEIGKQEQLKHLIDTLKSIGNENSFFKKPFSVLNKLSGRYNNISTILSSEDNNAAKIGKVNHEMHQINQLLENEQCELSDLKNLLSKVEFYKDILFNPASHSNDEVEVYRKECIASIKLLEELNSIVNSLK